MTDDDLKQMAILVIAGMKEHHASGIDLETHAEQHEFIGLLLQERRDRLARRKAVEDKIAGSLVLSLVLGTISLVGAGAMQFFRDHLK